MEEQIKQYLKENLKIEIELKTRINTFCIHEPILKVSLSLKDDLISESFIDIKDLNFTLKYEIE